MGSAIASIHILGVRRWGVSGANWFIVALTFTWVALTAAGPFIFLERRYARRIPNYPQIGDRLWALLGIPWLVTALVQSAAPTSEPGHNPWFTMTLSTGLAIVCLIARGRRLEHVGHGSSPAGRADRGGTVDQPRRTDSIDRLAHPMRIGHGRLELTGTCMHSV